MPQSNTNIFVPKGAFEFSVSEAKPTRWFNFLLLPQFTLLAFSAALEPLRIANQLAQKPLYGWKLISENGVPVLSSSGVDINVDCALLQLDNDAQVVVCSGNLGDQVTSEPILNALRRHHRFGVSIAE